MPNDDEVFRLRPRVENLRMLARGYLKRPAGTDKTSEAADRAAFNAGRRIREGDRSKPTLKEIVSWKNSESWFWGRIERQFDRNDAQSIAAALDAAVTATTGAEALAALTNLVGIGVPTASAILTAIFPEKYTVIDQLALRALGVANAAAAFYLLYNNYCRSVAAKIKIDLRTLDRALWEWGKTNPPSRQTSRIRQRSGLSPNTLTSQTERDGVPVLPVRRPEAVVTMDTVKKLRDD
jgi:hypothetical protein